MIGKQRPGKAAGVGFMDDRAQPVENIAAVNSLLFDSFADHMLTGAGGIYSGFPWLLLTV